MEIYKELYLYLFNSITDAIDALGAGRAEDAVRLLTDAQYNAEERFISDGTQTAQA